MTKLPTLWGAPRRGLLSCALESEQGKCPRTKGACPKQGISLANIDLATIACEVPHDQWPRGVTVSTLDSESSYRGPNPREASGALG